MSAEHLQPSQLGTKEYWDKAYTTELRNFESNPDDEGTIWFSDSAAEEKILAYLTETLCLPPSTRFLDLGTGNGHLLFLLRADGEFEGEMVGVDYSEQSVQLARRVAEEKGVGDDVRFEKWDIMREAPGAWLGEQGFDVVLDKGTFDAISLSEEVDEQGRRIFEGYRERVERLVKAGGMVLITSCNWTEAELRTWFEGGELEYHGKIHYPSFTFAGQKGQTISSVCFQKEEGIS